MESNSDFVINKSIHSYILILDLMAEQGPFDKHNDSHNQQRIL